MTNTRPLLAFPLFLILAGCDDVDPNAKAPPLRTAKSVEAPAEPTTSVEKDPAGTTERNFNGAIFQVPNAWKEMPVKNDFIKVDADFRLAGADGEARLTLSSAGGSVAENVNRWKGQFQSGPNDPDPRESTLSVDGKDATLVELFGSFRDMTSKEAKRDSAMLGVVIPLQGTNYFVKLTGPRRTVTDVKDAVLKVVETARFRE